MVRMCLIAEHDPWDIQLLRLYAEQLGFDVAQSFETQTVVPLVRQTHPAVILLEAELPGTFGYQEVIRQLRSDPDTSGTVIILVSRFDHDPALCSQITCLETLLKPATFSGLQDCLERAGVWQPSDGP